jgi:hypothetical protein
MIGSDQQMYCICTRISFVHETVPIYPYLAVRNAKATGDLAPRLVDRLLHPALNSRIRTHDPDPGHPSTS